MSQFGIGLLGRSAGTVRGNVVQGAIGAPEAAPGFLYGVVVAPSFISGGTAHNGAVDIRSNLIRRVAFGLWLAGARDVRVRGNVFKHVLIGLGLEGAGLQGLGGDAGLGQHPGGRGVLVHHEGEEQVLRVDVGGAEGARDLVGIQQGALGGRRERRSRGGLAVAGFGQALFGVGRDGGGVATGTADGRRGGFLLHHHAQQVQGVDVGVAVVDGELSGLHEEFVGAPAEQPGDLDGSSALGALALQVAGQELVE
jgi:hypothetical protein